MDMGRRQSTIELVAIDMDGTLLDPAHRGIDYQGGMNNWRHSVLNDPDHAYASAYDKMRMEGAGRLTASRIDAVTGRRWRIGSEDTLGQDEIARDIDMPTADSTSSTSTARMIAATRSRRRHSGLGRLMPRW